jgi:hypothetical protein
MAVHSGSRPSPGESAEFTRKRKPVAALAADCQKAVAECEYPRTAIDRRYGLMAPKRVAERHVEAFNAWDADARFIGTHTGVMRTPAGHLYFDQADARPARTDAGDLSAPALREEQAF